MKYLTIKAISLTALALSLFASPNAEIIFDKKCNMCHLKTSPKNPSKMIAPILGGIMFHVKKRYPNKKDAVAFIVDYVLSPSRKKSVCSAKTIARFGYLMPSQKGNISKKELKKVAEWMFENYPSKNFMCPLERKNNQKRINFYK